MFLLHLLVLSTSRGRDLKAEEELSTRKVSSCKWMDYSTLSYPLLPQYPLKNEWGPFPLRVLKAPAMGAGTTCMARAGWQQGSSQTHQRICFY